MRIPSLKTLRDAFPSVAPRALELFRIDLRHGVTPQSVDDALAEANKLLEGHGVEALYDGGWSNYYHNIGLLYVNQGDPYLTTVMYDTRRRRFYVGCWGDYIERSRQLRARFRD